MTGFDGIDETLSPAGWWPTSNQC